MKDRHNIETTELMNEVSSLTEKIEDNKDKETIRKLRKELDEYKIKSSSKELEADELRINRDRLRDEKNENLLKFSK